MESSVSYCESKSDQLSDSFNADLAKLIAMYIAKHGEMTNLNRGEQVHLQFRAEGVAIIRKGEDWSQSHHFSIPWLQMFTILLGKTNGVTIRSIVREAFADPDGLNDRAEIVKNAAKEAIRDLKGLGERSMDGKCTAKVSFARFHSTEHTDRFDLDLGFPVNILDWMP